MPAGPKKTGTWEVNTVGFVFVVKSLDQKIESLPSFFEGPQ